MIFHTFAPSGSKIAAVIIAPEPLDTFMHCLNVQLHPFTGSEGFVANLAFEHVLRITWVHWMPDSLSLPPSDHDQVSVLILFFFVVGRIVVWIAKPRYSVISTGSL